MLDHSKKLVHISRVWCSMPWSQNAPRIAMHNGTQHPLIPLNAQQFAKSGS